MNETTRASLEMMRDYWMKSSPPMEFTLEALNETEAALAAGLPLDDSRLVEYLDRLGGPEGCNFREEPELSWECAGGTDKSKSTAILESMGLDESGIADVHRVVDALGGHCDCEILFNAMPRMFPEPQRSDDG